jgi:hypothetical protein
MLPELGSVNFPSQVGDQPTGLSHLRRCIENEVSQQTRVKAVCPKPTWGSRQVYGSIKIDGPGSA